jgi:hypothetical protein
MLLFPLMTNDHILIVRRELTVICPPMHVSTFEQTHSLPLLLFTAPQTPLETSSMGLIILFSYIHIKHFNHVYPTITLFFAFSLPLVTPQKDIFFLYIYISLGGTVFELRALSLLGRCSTTWTTLPALFCIGHFWDQILWTICPGLALSHNLPGLCFLSSQDYRHELPIPSFMSFF